LDYYQIFFQLGHPDWTGSPTTHKATVNGSEETGFGLHDVYLPIRILQ